MDKRTKILQSKEPYEPEAIVALLPGIDNIELNRLQATLAAMKTNAVREYAFVFEKFVLANNDKPMNSEFWEGCLISWIWKAIEELKKIDNPVELSNEVEQYIKYMSNNQGVFFYPEELDLEQDVDLTEVKKRAETPELLKDDNVLDIQAAKYAAIQLYINGNIS